MQQTELPESAGPGTRADDVRVIGAKFWAAHDEAEAHENIEVSLLPPTTALLRAFPVAGLDESYLRHLDQRIVRHPRELVSHVRRILLLRELERADSLAGALLDLFIVLGKRGRALRARLLRMIESRITPDEREFFRAHLDNGVSPTESMPLLPQSRLSRQVVGTTRIVATANSDDAFEVAKESLASGQVDIALELLEGLLELDPGSPEVCSALLDLYEQRDDRDGFFRTYTRFLGRELGEPQRWRRLANTFQEAEDPAGAERPTILPDLAWLK